MRETEINKDRGVLLLHLKIIKCKLVPSNASEVSSDSTRKDLGRILTPNLQAIRVLQSNNVFNFITSESQLKI